MGLPVVGEMTGEVTGEVAGEVRRLQVTMQGELSRDRAWA